MFSRILLFVFCFSLVITTSAQDFENLSQKELWEAYNSKKNNNHAFAAYFLANKHFKHNYDSALIINEVAIQSLKAPNEFYFKALRNKFKFLCKLNRIEEAKKIRLYVIDNYQQKYLTLSHFNVFLSNTIIDLVNIRKMEEAALYLNDFEQVLKRNNHPNIGFYYHYTYGYYNYFTGDYQKVLYGFETALENNSTDIPPDKITGTRMNIGIIHYREGRNEKAKGIFLTAVEEFELQEDRSNLANAFVNLASVYDAEEKIDSVIYTIEKAKKIYQTEKDSSGIANCMEYLAHAYTDKGDYAKSLEFHLEALKIRRSINDPLVSSSYNNIADAYMNMNDQKNRYKYLFLAKRKIMDDGANAFSLAILNRTIAYYHSDNSNFDSALIYIDSSLSFFEKQNNPGQIASGYLTRGNIFKLKGEVDNALSDYVKSYNINLELNNQFEIAGLASNIGAIYLEKGNYQKALHFLTPAMEYRETTKNQKAIMEGHLLLAKTYDGLNVYDKAFYHLSQYSTIKDSVFYGTEMNEKLAEMRTKYETEEIQDSLANQQLENEKQVAITEKQKAMTENEKLKTDAANRRVFIFIILTLALLAGSLLVLRMANQRKKANKIIALEKEKSENLLLNILPKETAEELKEKGFSEPQFFDSVSVLFTDFKGFTMLSEQLTARELVEELNFCFKAFDEIMEKFGIEKIKTIGDAYMAAGGLPVSNLTHPVDTVKAALAIRDFMNEYKKQRDTEGRPAFQIRIGVHTGNVVAGIVGIKKFQYDIWGDTVNTAARMESSGKVAQVNISHETYLQVKNQFTCTYRGEVAAKNKGNLAMYFVDHS